MKIDSSTNPKDVVQKAKEVMRAMQSQGAPESSTIGKDIRALFDRTRYMNLYDSLKEEEKNRILELQEVIKNTRNIIMSIEEIIKFLESAMNYGAFQIQLFLKQMNGENLDIKTELEMFLNWASNEEILQILDIKQNYNEKNIDKVRARKKD